MDEITANARVQEKRRDTDNAATGELSQTHVITKLDAGSLNLCSYTHNLSDEFRFDFTELRKKLLTAMSVTLIKKVF